MENLLNFFKSFVYLTFVYLGIKTGVVKILFFLMIIDSVLGMLKAFRLNEKISLKKLAWGMVSKLTLLIVPMILALMAKGLNFEFNYFVVAVLNVIIVNEGISCITNILSIKTMKQIENADYITSLLHTIRKALVGIIKRLLSSFDIENNK